MLTHAVPGGARYRVPLLAYAIVVAVVAALLPGGVAAPAHAGGYAQVLQWNTDVNDDIAAAPDGSLWSVDGASTLTRWDPVGTRLGSVTVPELVQASAVAVAADGTLFVSDRGAGVVVAISPTGQVLREYLGPPSFSPNGLDFGPSGEVVVSSLSGDTVEVFAADGTWLRTIGASGAGPGQLDRPDDVVVVNGVVFVADYFNDRVQRFGLANGTYLGGFGQAGSGPGQFDTLMSLDVTPSGNVLAYDSYSLQEFTAEGGLVSRTDHGLDVLYDWNGMAADGAGAVYMSWVGGFAKFAVPTMSTPAVGTASLTSKRIAATGKRATLRIRCANAPCKGRLVVTSRSGKVVRGRLAATRFSLGEGRARVKVTLKARARKALRDSRKIRVKVVLTSGGERTTNRATLVRRR